ncbi:hypothetical protein ERJ75_001583000 [Trypanosoma vivax]|nr:hypothetical protein ERJ75_001583000 [Trypanosoma vivax]
MDKVFQVHECFVDHLHELKEVLHDDLSAVRGCLLTAGKCAVAERLCKELVDPALKEQLLTKMPKKARDNARHGRR